MERGGSVGWSDARWGRGLHGVLAALVTAIVFALALSPCMALAEVDTSRTPAGYWDTAPYWMDSEGNVVVGNAGEIKDWSNFPVRNAKTVSFQKGTVFPGYCDNMFRSDSLTSIDLSNVDFSHVISIDEMFQDCDSLESIDLSGLDLSNVSRGYFLLAYCDKLKTVDMSGIKLGGAVAPTWDNFRDMFWWDKALETVDLSGATIVTDNLQEMFAWCENLKSVNFQGSHISTYTKDGTHGDGFTGMFIGCSKLESLDLRTFDTLGARSMSEMFFRCTNLKSVNLNSFDTSTVTTMYEMFGGCSSLQTIDVSLFDTSKVENMNSMFEGCSSVTSLDLSGFDTSKITSTYNMSKMLSGCTSLQRLTLSEGFFNASVDLRSAAGLPDVTDMSGYDAAEHTGKWVRESDRTPSLDEGGAAPSLKSDALMAGDASDAGTWVWQGYVTLSFDANGGEGAMDAVAAGCGDTVQLAPCAYVRKAYDFAGWNTSADGSGTAYADAAEVPVAQDTVLYAQWAEQEYTLTYDPAGGSWADGTTDAISRSYGKASDPATILDAPTREGYVFVRWQGSSYQPGDAYDKRGEDGLLTDDTLTAVWEKAATPTPTPGTTTDGGKAQPKADRTDSASQAAMPQTGDTSMMAAPMAVAGIAALAAAALMRRRIRG